MAKDLKKALTRKTTSCIAFYPQLSEIAKNCKGEPLLKENVMVNILYKQQLLEPFYAGQQIKSYILQAEVFNKLREFIY
ncbi:hypothetical protein QYM23_08925 [Bacillus cereus]|uniref:Uncharacterized protein n=1 Tax=Bacillus cereus TaxID=1396 RepID=A0AAW7NDG4_BACCE|nr:hypothetical protein [Bacillus cereus]MDN4872979.1 hypothetical protein [Bacillus cereus]WHT91491.1 hypothetical protein QM226_001735 [Bacillus cereus]